MKARIYFASALVILGIGLGLKVAGVYGGAKDINKRHNGDGSVRTAMSSDADPGETSTSRFPRDPHLAKAQLLEQLTKILESDDRNDLKMDKARAVVGELSKLLPASDVITILNGHTGGGTDFSLLISEVFLKSGDDLDTLCRELEKLTDPHPSTAVTGLFQRISGRADFPASLAKVLGSNLPPSALQGLNTALHLEMIRSSDPKERARELIQLARSLPQNASKVYLPALLGAMAEIAPERIWEVASDPILSGLVSVEQIKKSKDLALANLVRANPKSAVELLVLNSGSADEFTRAGLVWANSNPRQFESWMVENGGDLSPEQGDGLRSGFARATASASNFGSAWEMVEEISDPKVKKQTEGFVWEQEKLALRSEVGRSPQEAVDGIVNGTSRFSDYWLEEAIGTWAAKDLKQAVAWNDENWTSLPASKAQYVAAAFAKHSLKQQDVDAARQWSALIQDEKTKARIEAAIAKAGAGQ